MNSLEQSAGARADLQSQAESTLRVRPFFRWFDVWVGAYWDRQARALYVCPLPMIGLRIDCRRRVP